MQLVRLLVILIVAAAPFTVFASDLGSARFSLLEGDVQIYSQESGEWSVASLNMPLQEGDRIWVSEDGRAEIQVRGGDYIRLEEGTAFDLLSLSNGDGHFYMDRGHAYINNRRGGMRTIQVDAPAASTSSYENSIMMLDTDDADATEISVIKGYVYVETSRGKTRVGGGKALRASKEGEAELFPIAPPDDWERWNLKRDRELQSWGESARYLPDELHDYSADFDRSGRWLFIREYGYVWSPTVVDLDWVPFRLGQWIWARGDYVWVSPEPWGWAPYHYGRWAYVAGSGWCWVPPDRGEVHWGPGYVAWINTGKYVAWAPLAPGEIYYGRGNYGPGSVNIVNVNINKTVIRQEIRNVQVKNAVTVVRAETFAKGRPVRERIEENLFVQAKGTPGPPVRKPHTPSAVEMPTLVPPVKQPPERVNKISHEEIKAQRKFTRQSDMSAFRPERPENLPVRKREEPKVIIRKQRQRPVSPAPGKPFVAPGEKDAPHERREGGEGKPRRHEDKRE